MNLTDFFIPSLISAIYTLCIGLSVYALSVSLGKLVFRNEAPWTKPLYFFSGLGAIGWIIWVASLLGLADVWFLRVITWLIIGSSAILIKKGKFSLPSLHLNRPSGYNFGSRAFFLLCAAVAMAAIIISLAAPTDADSLDYHLGVPLEILRNHGSIWFNQDHLHYRMAGFGEMLNLIGVVNGCPQLGSFLQVLGLILLIDLLALISGRPITTVFALCFGIPVIFALLFTQKHQYTGIISSTICFIAVSQFSAEIRGRMLVPFALSLFMADSIKHSFLLSSICVLTLWVLRLGFGGSLKSKLLVILLLGLVILAPQYGYRWQHFGDPLAPLLETLKSEPDFAI